jgi:tetratricopeptide (TPR) repeat protein
MLNGWGRVAVLAWVVASAATVSSCKTKGHDSPLLPGVTTGAPVRVEIGSVVRSTLAETREEMAKTYRLAPDNRLLDAVAYLDARINGSPAAKVEARFADGQWHITYRGQDVGTLPEVPGFEDGDRMLSAWATRLLGAHPLSKLSEEPSKDTPDSVGLLFFDSAVEVLRRSEGLFANAAQQGTAIRLAAGAISSLVFQLVDTMQTADDLYARAWGLVVLEHALGARAPADRTLLAEALGYHASAREIAESLPENHSIRAYVLHDDDRLQAIASKPAAATGTHFLWVARLLERDKLVEATAFRKRWFGGLSTRAPLVLFRLAHADFDTKRSLSPAAPLLVLLETAIGSQGERAAKAEATARALAFDDPATIGKVALGLGVAPSEAIEAFDAELDRFGKSSGALGAATMLQAYYKAAMYSSLQGFAHMLVYTLASNERAKQLALVLGDNKAQTATQFKLWYDYLVTSKSGVTVTGELFDKIQGLAGFGAQPLTELFEELLSRLEWGSPVGLTAARRLMARLDSRVSNRSFVARVASDGLLDLKMAEKMYRSAIEAAPGVYPKIETWLAGFTGDPKLFAQAMASPDLLGEDRIGLLEQREDVGLATSESTLAEMNRVASDDHARWETQKRLIDYLMKKNNFDDAYRVAHDWLTANPKAPGLDPVFARIAMAKSLRAVGRDAEALHAVRPAVESWQGGAMYQTATLLGMSGEKARAKELMQARLDRYPVPESVAGVVELLWRLGEYPQAAQTLVESKIPLSTTNWRDAVGNSFVEVFVRSKVSGAISAFEALKKTKIAPLDLLQIPSAVNHAGDERMALDLLMRIDDPKVGVYAAFRGYPLMKKLDGEAAAITWATPKVRRAPPVTAASLCVADACEDAIWLLEEPPAGDNRDLFWLFRAVVVARHRDSPHRAEVAKYFETKEPGRYHVMGRTVMGMEPETAVTALAGDIHQRCEAAFYLGAAAEGQAKIEDAADWYRAALETNLIQENEYHFAYNQLSTWRSSGKSLSRIAASSH